MRLLVIAALLAAPAAQAHAQAVAAHPSWSMLSWSNGFAASAYDTSTRRVTGFREHLYARHDQTTATRELMYDLYFGVRVGGQNEWLTARPVSEASYEDGGVVRIVQRTLGVTVTQRYFAPFSVDAAAMVAVVEIENTGTAPLTDAAVFALDNLHVGGGADGTQAESITWQAGGYEERGAAGLVLHRPTPAPTAHATNPMNPYQVVAAGGRLSDVAASGTVDDAVAGFEWDLAGLAPGATRTIAVVLGHRADGDRAALDAALASLPDDPAQLLAQARADWADFFAGTRAPDGLSAEEASVYHQQLAILRMGQVREPGPGHGQVVASLPPGKWNTAWVRDQAYAASAMAAAGMTTQARDAIEFWWSAEAGDWVCCDRDGGPWVGTDYAVSVVRYTGDGHEESDVNAAGPNVEFDGFGLALAATDDFVEATGDTSIVDAHADAIFARTADVLVGLVEHGGGADGLIRADSSIWETHWYDGGRRHQAFTQAAAVRGLRAAARLADRLGRAADAVRYRAAADTIAAAIRRALVDPATGILRGSLEETTGYLDASAVEAWSWGALPANDPALPATLDALRAGLWNDEVGHGYHRNDDGGDYDRREWAVIDLRVARAAALAGRPDHAAQLIDWVTAQATANYDLIPENYDRVTGDYQGEVPMVGFGAGAYVTALWERGPAPQAGADAGGDDSGTEAPTGCGCASSADPGSTAVLALIVLVSIGSRRRRPARTPD